MGTHRTHAPDSPPAQRTLLTYTTVREHAERVRVSFSGEVDLSSADVIDTAVFDALRSHHPRHVDVDLADVRFLDASGIQALLRCRMEAVEAGCQLAVTNPQPMVYLVLEITGVLAALAVTPVLDKPIDSRSDRVPHPC
jgi:anti-sigma B factor antagonist